MSDQFLFGVVLMAVVSMFTSGSDFFHPSRFYRVVGKFIYWLPFNIVVAFASGFALDLLVNKTENHAGDFGVFLACLLFTLASAIILEFKLSFLTQGWDEGRLSSCATRSGVLAGFSFAVSSIPYVYSTALTGIAFKMSWIILIIATLYGFLFWYLCNWVFDRSLESMKKKVFILVRHLVGHSVCEWDNPEKLLGESNREILESYQKVLLRRRSTISSLLPVVGNDRGIIIIERELLPPPKLTEIIQESQEIVLEEIETWCQVFKLLLSEESAISDPKDVLKLGGWDDDKIQKFVSHRASICSGC
jgi:hypothetical protein